MGLLCCATKCCGCIVLSHLCALLLPLAILAALGLVFYTYAIPWGEDQIRQALDLASDVDIQDLNSSFIDANSCSGCVFGRNTQWPMNTTGPRHFLDTKAGGTASVVIAISLAGAAVISTGSMLWASLIPSAATALSFSGGFYEMTHIVEQAQFAGMISQLRIEGAPAFLLEFSKGLSWTNFNFIKGGTDYLESSGSAGSDGSDGTTRRLEDSGTGGTGVFAAAEEAGPARYAALIGVDADNLFFYTLGTFAVAIAVLHVLFLMIVLIAGALTKNKSLGDVARMWYRKIIWTGVLALLLAQYMFAMAGSYFISTGSSGALANGSSSRYAIGIAALAVVVLAALGLGIIVIGNNTDELKDVGTYEHDQRAFSNKYSAYYDEYNFDNRFFFVPRILLAVMTGAVVGVVRDATTQLLCILAFTVIYMTLLLIRQPNLLRFLYYLGIASVLLKVVLICLMLVMARADYFPQSVRDNMAYGIIGVNMFIFSLLVLRQAYTIIVKMIAARRHKKNGKENSGLDATDINLESGNNASTNCRNYEQVETTPAGYGVVWYDDKPPQQHNQLQQQQQYQTQTSNISGYSTESSRGCHSDNVPMLASPEAVPVLIRSRGTIHSPVSRNQQYSFGSSTRSADAFQTNNAASTRTHEPIQEAPIPTYDVLVAYLGTGQSDDEAALSSSRGHFPRGQHLSREQSVARGHNSIGGLASPRGPPSSRGYSARGGVAIGTGLLSSGLGPRPSTVPLDAYVSSFSGVDSGTSNSSSRRKRNFNREDQRKDVDIDDVDIDADNDNIVDDASSLGASKVGQHRSLADSARSSLAMMERSYVNFSDSLVSSASSKQGTSPASAAKSKSAFSAAMGAAGSRRIGGYGSSPQGKMSIFSNDSERSVGSESSTRFKRWSRTALSVDEESVESNEGEGQSYELGPLGVTMSAFKQRESVDSYGNQSKATFSASRVDFGRATDMGSDDGRYIPRRHHSGASNQSSNQSFLSAQSDDSGGYYDVDIIRRDMHSTLTL
uniref:TRP C-terminal domain-containing protein n=1 Tax=Hyaloperonospora arabidopsidis (strain Emoy2) TaxID=559515 RepID=M4BT25_HYAAE